MKTMKKLVWFCAVIFAMASCSKEGPPGEPGPRGEQGEQGPQGPAGTANVIYSDWLKISFEPVASLYFANIPVPDLTQEIADKGEVSVYYKSPTSRIFKLDVELNGANYVEHYFFVGGIEIWSTFDGGAGDQRFRYVFIPGGVPASAKLQGVNLENYKEVAQALQIAP